MSIVNIKIEVYMKKTLTKILLISLLFSAIMPTGARANGFSRDDVVIFACVCSIVGCAWYFTSKKKTFNKQKVIDNNLKQAIRNNDIAKVNQILKENPIIKKINSFLVPSFYCLDYPQTPLRLAVQSGHPEIVKLLLKDRHVFNRTGLPIAVTNGHTEIVKLLLGHGANVNEEETHGTPLLIAVKNGHTEIVRLLLEHGANVNGEETYGEPYNFKKSPPKILIAVKNGHTEIAKLLLEYGADANVRDKNGRTALMIAAERSQYAKKAENIELKNEFDNLIRLLLIFGANPLIKDNNGRTVLDQTDNEVIRKFMDQKILPILNDKEFTPLTENPA